MMKQIRNKVIIKEACNMFRIQQFNVYNMQEFLLNRSSSKNIYRAYREIEFLELKSIHAKNWERFIENILLEIVNTWLNRIN